MQIQFFLIGLMIGLMIGLTIGTLVDSFCDLETCVARFNMVGSLLLLMLGFQLIELF